MLGAAEKKQKDGERMDPSDSTGAASLPRTTQAELQIEVHIASINPLVCPRNPAHPEPAGGVGVEPKSALGRNRQSLLDFRKPGTLRSSEIPCSRDAIPESGAR